MSKLGPVKCVPFLNMLVLWRLCLFLPAFSGPACHSWLNPSKWSIAQFSIGSTASTGFRGFEKLSIPAKRVLFGLKMTKLLWVGSLGRFQNFTAFFRIQSVAIELPNPLLLARFRCSKNEKDEISDNTQLENFRMFSQSRTPKMAMLGLVVFLNTNVVLVIAKSHGTVKWFCRIDCGKYI